MIANRDLRRLLRPDRTVTMWADIIKVMIGAVVIVAIAFFVVYHSVMVRFMYTQMSMNDFGKFYYSTRMFRAGGDMYGSSPATVIRWSQTETREFLNMNPPHFHILILPLSALAPPQALSVWALINLAALVASLRVVARSLSLRWTAIGIALTALTTVGSAATGAIVVTGQLTFILLWPLTAAWSLARRGSWNSAGWLLGVAISIKPFLGLFAAYLLITRRTGALARCVAALAITFLLGFAVFGVAAHESWLRTLYSVTWTWAPMNASVAGLFSRAFSTNPFFRPVIEAPEVAVVLATVVSIIIAGLSLRALAADRSPEATDRAFGVLAVGSLLVSPLGWIYYLWLAVGPSAALWQSRRQRPSNWRSWLLGLAAPGLFFPLFPLVSMSMRWPGITLGSLYGWSVLLLFGAFVADWYARDRNSSSARTIS